MIQNEQQQEKDKCFHFKHFVIGNNRSAMKVNTDGVLLGAWSRVDDGCVAWDVGCGTGVIGIMLAQRGAAKVTGIEIEHDSWCEASDNFRTSAWRKHLEAVEADINDCYRKLDTPDLIVSNPPYFSHNRHSLKSPEWQRSRARHEDSLGYESLIDIACKTLSKGGRLCFISPIDREQDIDWWITINKMEVERKTMVAASPKVGFKRILWQIGRLGECNTRKESLLHIRDGSGNFTSDYTELVKDFYTNI